MAFDSMNLGGGDEDNKLDTAAIVQQVRDFAAETQVEIEGTRFSIEKLPAVQAHRTWRSVLHELGKTEMLDQLGKVELAREGAAVAVDVASIILKSVLRLPPSYLETLQRTLFTYVRFQNERARTTQAVAPAQDTAFDGLDPIDIEELLVRSLAVNFTKSLLKLGTRLARLDPASSTSNPEV